MPGGPRRRREALPRAGCREKPRCQLRSGCSSAVPRAASPPFSASVMEVALVLFSRSQQRHWAFEVKSALIYYCFP